jgi:hypothetical protein
MIPLETWASLTSLSIGVDYARGESWSNLSRWHDENYRAKPKEPKTKAVRKKDAAKKAKKKQRRRT